jgi:hypothetical protein
MPQINESYKIFQADRHLGWRFFPNITRTIIHPGEAHLRIRTNSWGFRDDEFDAIQEDKRKVMVVGDSFTSNLAVSDDFVFTEIMERSMKSASVMNFGVNGYNNVQEYLLIEKYIDTVKPDLLLVVFYIRNDFNENVSDNWYYWRPTAHLKKVASESVLQIATAPSDSTSNTDRIHFQKPKTRLHLYQLLVNSYSNFRIGLEAEHRHSPNTPPEFYLCKKTPSEETKEKLEIAQRLILKISNLAKNRNLKALFILAPSILQVDKAYWDFVFDEFSIDSSNYSNSYPNDRLVEFAHSKEIEMLDLLPFLNKEYKKGNNMYNKLEQHWNKNGNKRVASIIQNCIENRNLLDD